MNSQVVCPEVSTDEDLCRSREEPSLGPVLIVFSQRQPLLQRQERQNKSACPSLYFSWRRSLSVFLSGVLTVF